MRQTLSRNGSQVSQIALVANKHDHDVKIGVLAQLLQPLLHVFERKLADIVDNQSTNSAAIVRTSNGAIAPDRLLKFRKSSYERYRIPVSQI